MVLGFAFNLGAFISSMTLHSLVLYTHSLCFATSRSWLCLESGLFVLDYYYLFKVRRYFNQLLLSSFKSVYNLHTCIRPLSYVSLCTLISNKIQSSTIGDSNQYLLYLFLFLFYSHLFLSITNLIILG